MTRSLVLAAAQLGPIQKAEGRDVAVGRIESYQNERQMKSDQFKENTPGEVTPPPKPQVKKQRVVKPADIVKTTYLETSDDVNDFLDALRQELEQAIKNNERIQIR